MSPSESNPPNAVPYDLMGFWMLPVRLHLNLMEQSFAFMARALPPAGRACAGDETVTREAEEQLATLDEASDTIPTTAALVA